MEKNNITEVEDKENCLNWLEKCNAECCSSMSFTVPQEYIDEALETGWLKIQLCLDEDTEHYLSLHGVVFRDDGFLEIPAEKYEIDDLTMRILEPCAALQPDLSCGIYQQRPDACKSLNDETAKDPLYVITKGCKYETASNS